MFLYKLHSNIIAWFLRRVSQRWVTFYGVRWISHLLPLFSQNGYSEIDLLGEEFIDLTFPTLLALINCALDSLPHLGSLGGLCRYNVFRKKLQNGKIAAVYNVISFIYWLDPANLFCLAEVMKILDTVLIYICLNSPFGKRKYFYCDHLMVSLYSLVIYSMLCFYSNLMVW